MILKEQWSLVRGLFTWKHNQRFQEKVILKERLSLVIRSFTLKYNGKGFRNSGLKHGGGLR